MRVNDADCVGFLQWALPQLGLRWPGFRNVRRQVCRRVSRRLAELGLPDTAAYRAYLERHDDEWSRLDGLCRVTVSRFWRDRAVFEALRDEVLPALGPSVRAWSAGCASGEEPYSLVLAAAAAGVSAEVLATDVDETVLARAREGRYPQSSLRELPEDVRADAFDAGRLKAEHRDAVTFVRHDVREGAAGGPFDLVLCRNLAFTYFVEDLQLRVAGFLVQALRPGGALVVGSHETPPDAGLEPWLPARGVWRRNAPS